MLIRKATVADVEALVALGKMGHEESPRYAHMSFDVERAVDFTEHVLENPWTLVLVAENDEHEVVGMLAGVVAPYFFAKALYASDVVFYVHPDYRGKTLGVQLLKEWDRVMSEDGRIVESTLGISSEISSDRTRALYEKLGYRAAGHLMVKQYGQ